HKENRGIVTRQVPIALLGIELQGKPPDIPFGIGSSPLPRHGRETCKHIGLLSDLGKYFCLGIFGDIMGNGKSTKSSRTLRVHTSFRDYFPVKMGQFLQEPKVFQKHWASFSRSFYILVLCYRSP